MAFPRPQSAEDALESGRRGHVRRWEPTTLVQGRNPLKTPLKAGEGVTFNLERDEASGQLQAADVARSKTMVQVDNPVDMPSASDPRVDLCSPKDLVGRQHCVGKVKSFRDDWGFITSDSFDGDLFLHLRDNPSLLPPLLPGETVEFTISYGQMEKLHAADVQRSSQRKVGGFLGQLCTGTVRKFSGEWGFIASPHFQGDLFVGKKSNRHLTGPLVPGDIVEFKVIRDLGKDKEGCYEASNVHVLSAAPGMVTTTPSFMPHMPRSRSPRRKAAVFDVALVGQRLEGTIRSFKDDWGFVTSTAFPGDLFVGAKSNRHLQSSLQEGDLISFTVEQKPGGKAEAVNVERPY